MILAWNPTLVSFYHAHIYFDSISKEIAKKLHSDFLEYRSQKKEDDTLYVGKMHEIPVGPHIQPMFQIGFNHTEFKTIVNYLMLNRRGLSVLVHPETNDSLKDHTEHPIWMGTPVPLDISKL